MTNLQHRTIRLLVVLVGCLAAMQRASAQTLPDSSAVAIPHYVISVSETGDTICVRPDGEETTFQKLMKRAGETFKKTVKKAAAIDTTYIQPNLYDWTVMAQNTNYFHTVSISTRQTPTTPAVGLRFSPQAGVKMGPYIGWKWIFLGYSFDISKPRHAGRSSEFSLCIYTRKIGADLMYIKNNENFTIRSTSGFNGIGRTDFRGINFTGLSTRTTCLNLYYIFNHRRFSYPAAYNQSTVQLRSAGSWLVGLRYDHQRLDFDYTRLPQQLVDTITAYGLHNVLDITKLRYTNISITGGYAYNWVPGKNWLVAISLTPAIGFKKISGERLTGNQILNQIKNVNIDFIGRLGVVWNTGKAFAGASFISLLYSYRNDHFSINNSFNYLNIYGGIYFGPKKKKKPKNVSWGVR